MTAPRYRQIRQFVLDAIGCGELNPGDRIPTEAALCERFGVSRMTVNKALRELTAEGWLVRTAGSGSFVADRRAESPLLEIRNIADEIAERGARYSARVIRLEQQRADDKVAVQLGLRVGAPIFHSLIVHQSDNEPLQLEERFVDAERLPGYGEQDFTALTPNAYLMQVCPLSEMEHLVEAVLPSAGEAALLQVRVDTPCLLLHRRTWSEGGLVSYARLLSPGDRYRLRSQTRFA
ncbi:histidine utilization repressor [Aeromonas diversa CDC 2478-85]|uniref:Histidine utilization repressor n=1 Tax=Aeromonas diversa CDC 2478-85 TaxID=1268237 RepID=N9U079_9GAMM|nr:histidine utilization repressor [Aeromonas diversa]ENY71774.1 histidine utilization repressor [Aeromonas diversa CDC 2478-85]